MKTISTIFFTAILALPLSAQVLTKEDSLNAGLIQSDRTTMLSGYGEAKVNYDLAEKTGTANLTRNVLFVGHRFNNKISLFTELEVEDAKVEGGEPGGEIAFEQMFLKFNINPSIYLTAGLFTPRFGIINENHLPTTYNGNDRPMVETMVIPATWRELGIGLYGQTNKIPGLNWAVSLTNGLNASEFGGGKGIREGRFEGRDATASNLALTGSLLYYAGPIRLQGSVYYGGSMGVEKSIADTFHLKSGAFGTPVFLSEFNVQCTLAGFTIKALATIGEIPDAENINAAFGNNMSQEIAGAYGEIGFNIFSLTEIKDKNLTVFGRFEAVDLIRKNPVNAIYDGTLTQHYLIAGVSWKPTNGIIIKADYVQRKTGVPVPTVPNFVASHGFFNLGIGYSF